MLCLCIWAPNQSGLNFGETKEKPTLLLYLIPKELVANFNGKYMQIKFFNILSGFLMIPAMSSVLPIFHQLIMTTK